MTQRWLTNAKRANAPAVQKKEIPAEVGEPAIVRLIMYAKEAKIPKNVKMAERSEA